MSDSPDVRARLEARLEQVVGRTDAVEKHLRGADGRHDADFEDRVAYTEMDEVLEQLDGEGRVQAEAIRAALGRLDAGTYGVCLSCGADIAAGRLAAIPEVALCTDCAAAR
ncbi:MAG: TraR/DksA family transcriptional regulator, partial [Myxococcales bacterium]|nr:TraR/DksA family transcriptional regulator [Myxococcales bacterium]